MMYSLFLLFLCLNLGTYLVQYVSDLTGAPTENIEPVIEPEQVMQDFNATQTVTSWSSFPAMFAYVGDVVGGLTMMWRLVLTFYVGFPMFLYSMGTPTPIVLVLGALSSFVITWAIIEFISGRISSD